jgi:dTDP-4-amino-4,6-dideoxy-D-galactose acyltransferase
VHTPQLNQGIFVQDTSLCKYLDWDSRFFGFRIGQVIPERLSASAVEEILNWCETNQIKCLYFLGDSDDPDTVKAAESQQFQFVDIRMTFDQVIDAVPTIKSRASSGALRPVALADLPQLRAIARTSYVGSRFYFDRGFPESQCNALYETWIDKSCRGYADVVLIADVQGQPAGFISCHLADQGEGYIGLVGVAKEWQGLGLGQQLVKGSLGWFADQSVSRVKVVTQARNVQAQRLYQCCGFLTRSVQLWYHRWF